MYKVKRYHDISCGHRVVGHESKCRHLHGHNYRIHFTCAADPTPFPFGSGVINPTIASELDSVGRVIDFGDVKSLLCMWVEEHWDHKFLAWEHDPIMTSISCTSFTGMDPELLPEEDKVLQESIVFVPFNPTAENMAQYLVDVVGPKQLAGTGIMLLEVVIDETRKCSASYGV